MCVWGGGGGGEGREKNQRKAYVTHVMLWTTKYISYVSAKKKTKTKNDTSRLEMMTDIENCN